MFTNRCFLCDSMPKKLLTPLNSFNIESKRGRKRRKKVEMRFLITFPSSCSFAFVSKAQRCRWNDSTIPFRFFSFCFQTRTSKEKCFFTMTMTEKIASIFLLYLNFSFNHESWTIPMPSRWTHSIYSSFRREISLEWQKLNRWRCKKGALEVFFVCFEGRRKFLFIVRDLYWRLKHT